jgi:threonyl-tRNA synthetase
MRRMGSPDQKVMPLAEAIATLTAEATPPDLKREIRAAAKAA